MTTEYLLNEQMEHVLAALTPSNRLVMRVCLHTGLRVGDVLALRTEQLQAPQFWITEQKTGKRRRVNLTNELFEQLRDAAAGVGVHKPLRPDEASHEAGGLDGCEARRQGFSA